MTKGRGIVDLGREMGHRGEWGMKGDEIRGRVERKREQIDVNPDEGKRGKKRREG